MIRFDYRLFHHSTFFARHLCFCSVSIRTQASTAMTEDELRTIVDVSHEDGVIESDEKEMIYNVFDLAMPTQKILWFPASRYIRRSK